jgi:hypothetical protein
MTPQSDVPALSLILLILSGIFLAVLKNSDWYYN